MSALDTYVRRVPNFPRPGILFYDITPLLRDPWAFQQSIQVFKNHFGPKKIDVVASMESRGFIFGSILAHELNAGFVPIRKAGKLPFETIKESFDLEYRKNESLEMHLDGVKENDRVLIIDDVLATGGTASATVNLIQKTGGKVEGLGFLIELTHLGGRKKLGPRDVFSILQYDRG